MTKYVELTARVDVRIKVEKDAIVNENKAAVIQSAFDNGKVYVSNGDNYVPSDAMNDIPELTGTDDIEFGVSPIHILPLFKLNERIEELQKEHDEKYPKICNPNSGLDPDEFDKLDREVEAIDAKLEELKNIQNFLMNGEFK
ncbi:ABC transporter C-terminal domain-containing protein [Bacillus toyonensis]|uniref:ABC transporter C-terminal domain-containing protein n=1 Tax=Bacillus toyonensis TaxID=155322 RepID=UPI002E23AC6C|nr:ABC transporter C-terminal domain-containing protein [Bacillus toyonensis]